MRRKYILMALLSIACLNGFSQHSKEAKDLSDQAVADTLLKRDSIAAIHFSQAAEEELRSGNPDYDFVTRSFIQAADLNYLKINNFQKAQDFYYKALESSHKSGSSLLTFSILQSLGTLYDASKNSYQVFKFPLSGKLETVEAYFPITKKPTLNAEGKKVIVFSGGSNDGVYEGAEGTISAKYNTDIKNRENVKLGTLKIIKVYPNFSFASVELYKENDPFYSVYLEDMALVPIRFPKKIEKDVFLQVSLQNIRFVDNSKLWIVHPRTLMYYGSPQVEKDVYAYMKDQVLEIYNYLHTDPNPTYHQVIAKGRFKGQSLMDALKETKTEDLKDFLDFVRSYPGKYVGGIWKISEVYATWIINDAPPGSNEAKDSLIAYYNDNGKFTRYLKENEKAISNDFFTLWLVDAQNMGYAKNFTPAFKLNDVLQKVSTTFNNDSLLAWSYFNRGLIHSEQQKDSVSIEYYKKARPLFAKAGDIIGESYCINNIGSSLQDNYKFT